MGTLKSNFEGLVGRLCGAEEPHDSMAAQVHTRQPLPRMTDSVFVVNTIGEYVGLLPITTLLVSDPSLTVREMMFTEGESILASTSRHDVAAV